MVTDSIEGALDGVKILDLTQIGAGPYATSLLGDFGADVIKIEPPEGDHLRYIDDLYGQGESAYFFGLNRSKRDISLDIKTDRGRQILDRMIQTADVLVVTMRPAALKRLGLDYKSLKHVNPRLIFCSITAFGEDGPIADEPGMDILAQARGGMMGLTGEPGRMPVKVGPPIADFAITFLACFAITLALRVRDQTGEGQKVSLNLLDGQVAMLANFATPYFRSGIPFRPVGGGHPQIVPYQVFEARDRWFVVACLTERFWPPFCRAIDRTDLTDDPRYATNADRVRNRGELIPMLEQLFSSEDAELWLNRMKAEDVPCSPVNRLEEVFEDPQVLNNAMLLELQHPRHGTIKTVNNPVRLSANPAKPRGYPPDLGEHSRQILGELGLSDAEIDMLIAEGIVK